MPFRAKIPHVLHKEGDRALGNGSPLKGLPSSWRPVSTLAVQEGGKIWLQNDCQAAALWKLEKGWKAESKNNGGQGMKEIPQGDCTDSNSPLLFRETAGGAVHPKCLPDRS